MWNCAELLGRSPPCRAVIQELHEPQKSQILTSQLATHCGIASKCTSPFTIHSRPAFTRIKFRMCFELRWGAAGVELIVTSMSVRDGSSFSLVDTFEVLCLTGAAVIGVRRPDSLGIIGLYVAVNRCKLSISAAAGSLILAKMGT